MAFSADNLGKESILPSDFIGAYSDGNYSGPTIRVLKYLAEQDGVDLIEVLKEDSPYATYRIARH